MKKTIEKSRIGTDSHIHNDIFKEIMKNKKAKESFDTESIMFDFIEKVKSEMKKKHLTNYALAKRAQIDHQVLARILNGQKNAELATLAKVANGIGARLKMDFVFNDR